MSNEIHPIQQKRRDIIDKISYLKGLPWDNMVKKMVGDLYDELEKIDKGL